MMLKEIIEVMQASLDGKPIECLVDGMRWIECPLPSWDWNNYSYRVKPCPPKRVFTVADFPPGTLVRRDLWEPLTWDLVVQRTQCSISTPRTCLLFENINAGGLKGWSFSTNNGITWEPLTP